MGANPRGRDSSLTPTPGCWTDPRWGKQLPPFSESQRYSVPERRDAIPLGHEWLFPQRGKQTLPLPESQVDNVSSLWDGILLGYGCFFPQRGSVPKPRVARDELPWVGSKLYSNPNGVVSSSSASPCPNPYPWFTCISFFPRKNVCPSSAIRSSAGKCTHGLAALRENLAARPSSSAAWRIMSISLPAMAGQFPKRTGSRNSNVLHRCGSKHAIRRPRNSPGNPGMAFFPLVPPTLLPSAITSRDRRSITGNGASRMNTGCFSKNTRKRGTSVTSGIEQDSRFIRAPRGHNPVGVEWDVVCLPRVEVRSLPQPWALGQIPVGENRCHLSPNPNGILFQSFGTESRWDTKIFFPNGDLSQSPGLDDVTSAYPGISETKHPTPTGLCPGTRCAAAKPF